MKLQNEIIKKIKYVIFTLYNMQIRQRSFAGMSWFNYNLIKKKTIIVISFYKNAFDSMVKLENTYTGYF